MKDMREIKRNHKAVRHRYLDGDVEIPRFNKILGYEEKKKLDSNVREITDYVNPYTTLLKGDNLDFDAVHHVISEMLRDIESEKFTEKAKLAGMYYSTYLLFKTPLISTENDVRYRLLDIFNLLYEISISDPDETPLPPYLVNYDKLSKEEKSNIVDLVSMVNSLLSRFSGYYSGLPDRSFLFFGEGIAGSESDLIEGVLQGVDPKKPSWGSNNAADNFQKFIGDLKKLNSLFISNYDLLERSIYFGEGLSLSQTLSLGADYSFHQGVLNSFARGKDIFKFQLITGDEGFIIPSVKRHVEDEGSADTVVNVVPEERHLNKVRVSVQEKVPVQVVSSHIVPESNRNDESIAADVYEILLSRAEVKKEVEDLSLEIAVGIDTHSDRSSSYLDLISSLSDIDNYVENSQLDETSFSDFLETLADDVVLPEIRRKRASTPVRSPPHYLRKRSSKNYRST